MANVTLDGIRHEVLEHLDEVGQGERGRDIDVLISEVAQTKFEILSKEHDKDLNDAKQVSRVKLGLAITSVCLAVASLVCAIVTVIFSVGTITVGTAAIAMMSCSVNLTPPFKLFRGSTDDYIDYQQKHKEKGSRINKLKNKIDVIRGLLDARIQNLTHLQEEPRIITRVGEILGQMKTVNGIIKKIKEQIPGRISSFDIIDPAPLFVRLQSLNQSN